MRFFSSSSPLKTPSYQLPAASSPTHPLPYPEEKWGPQLSSSSSFHVPSLQSLVGNHCLMVTGHAVTASAWRSGGLGGNCCSIIVSTSNLLYSTIHSKEPTLGEQTVLNRLLWKGIHFIVHCCGWMGFVGSFPASVDEHKSLPENQNQTNNCISQAFRPLATRD